MLRPRLWLVVVETGSESSEVVELSIRANEGGRGTRNTSCENSFSKSGQLDSKSGKLDSSSIDERSKSSI